MLSQVRSALPPGVPAVGAQVDGVKEGKKRKFGVASTKKKVEMKEEVEEKKAARRSFEGTKLEGAKKQDGSGHFVLSAVVLMKLSSSFDEVRPKTEFFFKSAGFLLVR